MRTDLSSAGAVFCRYLVNRIFTRGAGSAEDGEYVSPDRPRDRFFIGRLSPAGVQSVTEEILENTEDFLARLNPCSMRMRFLLRGTSDTRISVQPSFHVYTRVFPTYKRQLQEAKLVFAKGDIATLMPAFQRVRPRIKPLDLRLNDHISKTKEIKLSWDRDVLAQVSDVYRGNPPHLVSRADLTSEETYIRFLSSISGDPILPSIQVSMIVSAEPVEDANDLWEIGLALVNRSVDSDPSGKDRLYDEVVFDAGFTATLHGGFVEPYEFPALPKSYRFDRNIYGTGVNCAVVTEGVDSKHPTVLSTQAVPTYEQARFDHRRLKDTELTFEELAQSGCKALLRKIAIEMRRFDESAWEDKCQQLRRGLPGTEPEVKEFERDRGSFRSEIQRYEKGIECLQHPLAAKAFSLLNRTFQVMGEDKGQDRWRLFQIVFIVSLLPSVVGRELPEYASAEEWDVTDVVWFPTGGGKTEAYLGLTAFALFFDRLRGRERGMTALYRFPLRLLSLQQFQRVVRMVAAANRIKSDEKIGGKLFTVGHWIGSGGSPNQITRQEGTEYAEDPKLIQKYRKLAECPNPGCGDRGVSIQFDKRMWCLQHVCPQCGVLPVFIVDHELYRYVPSVVVSTVDKMAVFGLQRRFVNLMGWTRGFCSIHGYAPEDTCEICGKTNLPSRPIKDPVPTLHVQDELHLLKEELGAFDSHYETSIMEMQKSVPGSERPWKTIAATATIEEFERHVEHLYLHRGRRFPTSGPTYEKTFFGETDPTRISRLFVGVIPSGLTHINAMVAILWHFHREIAQLRELSPDKFLSVTGIGDLLQQEKVAKFLDQYEIGLNYVLTKRAGDQMAESLDAQIGNYLKEEGFPELLSEVLTGGTSSERITAVMNRIEKFDLEEANTWKRIRSVIATSMISHGVDVERFNFITFFGMPRMTSEYIQASSRVGRMYPGIVLVCFAPARERDRSHYHLFRKYHEYLDRLVEATAINRWSRFSIHKTIAGIVLGYVLSELARKTGRKLTTGRAIKQLIPEILTEEKLRGRVDAYYGAEHQPSKEFSAFIATSVAGFFNGLPNTATPIFKRRNWRPMRSLRDTDREVTFRAARAAAPLFELLLKDRVSDEELQRGLVDQADNDD